MSAQGPGTFHIIDESMTGDYYLKILQQYLVQNGTELCGNEFVFQQDNHPAHKTKKIQDYMERIGFQELAWPENSPDFSPIENMFATLKRHVADRSPRSIEDLKSVTREEWMGMDADYTKALVASMPARMQAGKRAHGGATRF
ncbi:putative Transposable element Tc1 transposase [Blattamonas nauphoetae]|uniref:Transposable element Tc1 transposase n=1 Tax=Blattamonas nauphoetae TaxID=2049346 RepID=A0ABQ9XDM2_9EUKA|nr:putative Transposable element Tc1 transposase [Blattamonas nauphoetae]